MIIEDLNMLLGNDFVNSYPELTAVLSTIVVCMLIYSVTSIFRGVLRL